ncbi:ABC transporter substrate-binding protein [Variovorax sp. H27-G14]|uniref:heme/hemin ABC transporter substrate-binding protein n=1 Tax=Variovorax sp. H27-G14 TaxID=3111914 RepID=UPI0038FC556D
MTASYDMLGCLPSFPRRRDLLRLLGASSLGAAALPLFAQDAKLPRLVTVSGAITEVVYLLGAEGQLVGTDTTSLYPAAARATPKVGYMRQLSAEGLLSLKPDAIIATNESGPGVVLDQVRSAGVKVEIIEADHSWGEVQRKVQAVGRAAAREAQARDLQARLDAEWRQVQQRVAASKARKPRVLFVLSHSASPQVSGEKTAAHAVIGFAGGVNALGGFQGYRPMTAEAMASAAPDLILTSTQSIEAHGSVDKFWQRPELALTPAFKKRSLVMQDALLLLGFGPRTPAAIAELHEKFLAAVA